MSDSPTDRSPEAAFSETLRELMLEAHEDGLTISRHWTLESEDGHPDWEVEIVPLKPDRNGADESET